MKKVLGKVFGRALVAAMLATAMLLCAMAPGLASNNDAWAALLDRTVTAVTQMTTQTGELTVIGTASVAVQPDMATVMLGVSVEDVSVAFAQARVNQTMQSIVDALQALGIDQNRMITSNYSVFPTYDFSQDSVTLRGYQVNNMLSVQVQEFALISQVIDRAVLAGANQVQGITFDTSKRNEIYRGALKRHRRRAGKGRHHGLRLGQATGQSAQRNRRRAGHGRLPQRVGCARRLRGGPNQHIGRRAGRVRAGDAGV